MKKISDKELAELGFLGKDRNPIIKEMKTMAVGENLLVEKKDFEVLNLKSPLASLIFHMGKGNFNCKTLKDKSGWVITRLK